MNKVGAFVRRTAPVVGIDRKALPHQFAARRGVAQIASERQAARAARFDISGDERGSAALRQVA